jgi:hypothetical protein
MYQRLLSGWQRVNVALLALLVIVVATITILSVVKFDRAVAAQNVSTAEDLLDAPSAGKETPTTHPPNGFLGLVGKASGLLAFVVVLFLAFFMVVVPFVEGLRAARRRR